MQVVPTRVYVQQILFELVQALEHLETVDHFGKVHIGLVQIFNKLVVVLYGHVDLFDYSQDHVRFVSRRMQRVLIERLGFVQNRIEIFYLIADAFLFITELLI